MVEGVAPGYTSAMGRRLDVRDLAAKAGRWAGFVGTYALGQAASMAMTNDVRTDYRRLDQPAFAPPPAAFPIAWSTLNVLGGTSAWRVWEASTDNPARRQALALWVAAIGLRTAYTPLAFGSQRRWLATADAAALALVMAAYAERAARVDRTAALLAVPEVGWTTFATVLSADVARRND